MFTNLPVITGKFSPFTENLLLPVNEILYRTIITRSVVPEKYHDYIQPDPGAHAGQVLENQMMYSQATKAVEANLDKEVNKPGNCDRTSYKTEKSFSNIAASQFCYSRSNKSTTTLQF
jgi:hypothetical protein